MTPIRRNRGFTLVELLVVTALFLLFFSLVAAGVRPNPASQVRRFSQDLSSAILAAQTRALSSESGAGLTIVSTTAAAAPSGQSRILGTKAQSANVPPYASGSCTLVPTSGTLVGQFSLSNTDAGDLQQNGYSIKLLSLLAGGTAAAAITPWLSATFNGSAQSLTATGSVTLDPWLNQTQHNTVLRTGTFGFVAARYPVSGAVVATAPNLVAIDMRYSGIHTGTSASLPRPTAPFGDLSVSGPVSFLFDRNGSLSTLMQSGTTPRAVVAPGPLYLLIATVKDISDGTSLQSTLSRWIVVAPDTGRVTVAMNTSTAITGTSATDRDLFNARYNARQAITQGAR